MTDASQRPHFPGIMGLINVGAAVMGALCLAALLVASGFAVDAYPTSTVRILAQHYSAEEDSPFNRQELVDAAVATAQFTVKDNDTQRLFDTLATINISAASAGRGQFGQAPDLRGLTPDESGHFDIGQLQEAIACASQTYVLDEAAISHLNDCYQVISKAGWLLLGCLVLGVACLAHVFFRCSRRAFGLSLAIPAGGVLAGFGAALAWLALDFNGLFAAFHGLFFQEGTWTFPWDSLLICMYPLDFWVAMGCIWFAGSIICSLICLVVGITCIRRSPTPATL